MEQEVQLAKEEKVGKAFSNYKVGILIIML
jgi:hypothetical protein